MDWRSGVRTRVNLALFPAARYARGQAKMDHEALRLLIQRKVRDGRLPHVRTARVWIGHSHREVCVACDTRLSKEQLLMESTTPTSDSRALQFHVHCFQIWDSERRSGSA